MDESEKRRERLKALRMEASYGGACNEVSSEIHQLSNPFVESSPTPPVQISSSGTKRFDYYTDPMAAFSNDKRMSKVSNQNSPGYFSHPRSRNLEMTLSPAHQVQSTFSTDPGMYQPQSPYHGSTLRNPEMSPSPAHHLQSMYSPDPRMYKPRSPYGSGSMAPSPAHQSQSIFPPNLQMHQPRGPHYNSGPRNNSTPPPAHQVQSGHFQGLDPYHNPNHHRSLVGAPSPCGVANSCPGFGGSPSSNPGLGTMPWSANSPNSSWGSGSGRGRGRWLGNNSHSGLGRGGNHGSGSHRTVSAELRPDLYYKKSMVEDPWKDLEPSLWKFESISAKYFRTPDSRNSSRSSSFGGTKKARFSGATEESGSQPSLAEFLAAAFNEAVTEGANSNEPSV